jgi:Autotransporter beta-domain
MKLKNIAVASAFVAGNLFFISANATSTNYFIGEQYSTYEGSSGNSVVGTFASNTSVTITGTSTTTGNFSIPTAYPSTGTNISRNATYMSLGAGTYNFSFSYSGPAATFVGICSGGGGPCPSGLGAFWRLSGQSVSTYFATAGDAVGATNSFSLTLASPGQIYVGLTNWYLGAMTFSDIVLTDGSVVTPSVDLAPNAYALRSVYNIQSAALNAGLSYDCNVFDKEGFCLSTGGRYSITNSPEATTTSGLLIGSYKYDKNIRVGAWVDQNLSTQNADGIKLSNNEPLFGVFGAWAERNDGLGYEVKVSAGYGDKDVTVTRTSTNEGSAKINSRGIQTISSYGVAIDGDWVAAPYVGVKYVSLKRGAYTEGGSSALTYDNLRQESTSVVAGVKFTGKIDPQTFTVLSAGVEQDLSNNVGQYSAGSSNTTAFNSNVQKTRPVVSAGVYYDIDKMQRVGLNATHRQEAFQSTATTSALATYTVGF